MRVASCWVFFFSSSFSWWLICFTSDCDFKTVFSATSFILKAFVSEEHRSKQHVNIMHSLGKMELSFGDLFMLKVIAPNINLFDSQNTELAKNHFLCV